MRAPRSSSSPSALAGWSVDDDYRAEAARLNREWDDEVARLYSLGHEPLPAQSEVIGAVNDASAPQDVVVCAAGSMPGDLHKLWRTRDPKGYHVEYGYSCMGYEIAGGLGVKMAAPEREVYVLVGDGSYLMMPGELVTAVAGGREARRRARRQPRVQLDRLRSRARSGWTGSARSTAIARNGVPVLDGDDDPPPPAARSISPRTRRRSAPRRRASARSPSCERRSRGREAATKTTVIVVEVDRYEGVPGYESWWDVPVAEVSELPAVQQARAEYEAAKAAERRFL